ncbi:lytic transglycosylase domain-containing protein [Myroides odoratimimus]|uniref:lytic transglycosylase domain-containing protein n=1 Tax=Myroides odoratimimus TaxID=76832 RepID=UPI0025783153|nr:lytic transglycosylase domain-containing protein [Myroides odoratimimus]MDM1400958.1 lytic transglycosylase domain-containing protein [Myroides odoratimimus]MDM1411183.1 lytic transglycosylase domain-containing protein [Myroides odoratimimus]MDM1464252.1 lytic transglycosylase domain-containing protein [Myroides odoratimimus]MDM1474573.1 lytic transglycosylase domain-containing protein [Myroides odoratimimus]MEC4043261.1 lytic transglycosylase domain-containing protein [Myroides odoratimimu
MKKTLRTVFVTAAIIAVASSFMFATTISSATEDHNEATLHAHPLPLSANFAGEKAPLDKIDVKERFDREMIINTNLHGTTITTIKRANRFFPIIEPILKKNGIPDDFKYLCVIESGLANAVSPAGASGFWQFMKGTSKDFNLYIDEYVDERYDLIKVTEAACKYFQSAKNRFGSWTMAAASYNRGMAGMSRAMESQYVEDYYDLFLNQETSRYVFRILALKEIMSNPVKYGFDVPESEKYPIVPTKKVSISYDIDDLALFAKEQGINYKLLKLYNPWLVNTSLKVKGKVYEIEIPTKGI